MRPPTKWEFTLSSPDITDAERRAVAEVLDSPQLALGPWLDRFEVAARERFGVAHAVAVSSGTAALHLLVRSLGWGPGDEIVTSPFSFVASANCILYEGARPVFADIDEETLNLDPDQVEAACGPRTRGLLPVHIFGLPCPMERISALAAERGLKVVEDACEAIGATVGDLPVGRWGDGASLAFYPNKQITTGEGGMVLTDDEDRAALIRSLANQGRDPDAGWFGHVRVGFNYRMSEIQAALGTVQVQRLDEILSKRDDLARCYARHLESIEGVRPLTTPKGMTRSWFLYPIRLDPSIDRDALVDRLAHRNVQTGRYFPPIHLLPPYRKRFGYEPGSFPVTERVSQQLLSLPFHNLLRKEDIAEIVGRLDEAIREVHHPPRSLDSRGGRC